MVKCCIELLKLSLEYIALDIQAVRFWKTNEQPFISMPTLPVTYADIVRSSTDFGIAN